MDTYGTTSSGGSVASQPPARTKTLRQRYVELWTRLDTEYATWRTVHEDICRYIQPHRGRFLLGEQNKGTRKDGEIVNDTATDSSKKLEAAMDTGITSPAREWFRLSTANPLDEEQSAEYLHELQDALFDVLGKSNFYKTHRQLYADVVGPATGLMFIEEDDEEVIRCIHVPIGQYRLAVDGRGRVSLVMRMFAMTAVQMVEMFATRTDGTIDWSIVSPQVKSAFDTSEGGKDQWFQVLHVVERRKARQFGKIDKKNKPWSSCWMEWAGQGGQPADASGPLPNQLLREDGYDEQPFVAPRWDVIGEDAYGKNSPAWQALGDVKGLQSLELSSAKTIAKLVDPPMNATDDLENASLLPGAVNYLGKDKASQFIPAIQIDHETVTVTLEEKREYQRRIERAFLNDILFIITNDQTAGTETAEAVRAKKDERLLQLGGAFGRMADEDLKICINRALAILQRKGLVAPPPPALRAKPFLRVEFQNILVSAQKTLGITAVSQLVAAGANLKTAGLPEALDNFDADEIVRSTADMLGTKPNLLLNKDQVAAKRAQRAQQMAKQQQQDAMAKGAPALKALSETDPQTLQQLLQQYGGFPAAAGTGVA